MKTDDMGVYLVSGPGQDAIWTALDEWVAASSYGVLVEANAAGLAEIRRRLAAADVAVDVVPAPADYYPDDTEGGVVVHEDGTWTAAAEEPTETITEDRTDTRRGLAQHTVSGERWIVEYCSLWQDQGDGDRDCVGTRIIAATGPISFRDLDPEGEPLEPRTALFDRIDSWLGLTAEDAAWLQAEEDAGRITYPIGVR